MGTINHLLDKHVEEIRNIDVLIAPHLNPESHIIVSIGVYLDYYVQKEGFEKHEGKYNYKGIELIDLPSGSGLLTNDLFVLKKSDLPKLTFNRPSEEYLTKYHLGQALIGDLQFYLIALKLNDNPDLIPDEEKIKFDPPEEMSLLGCMWNVVQTWGKKVKMIHIAIKHSYSDNGRDAEMLIQPFNSIEAD